MNTSSVVSVLCGLLGGAGLTAALFAGRAERPQLAAPSDPRLETVSRLEGEVAGIRGRLEALEKARGGGDDVAERPSAIPADPKTTGGADAAVASKPAPVGGSDLSAAVAQVATEGFSQEAIEALIKRIREENGHEAAIAAIKALVERDPGNAKAHYLLARAYVDQLMISKSYADMERLGTLCMAEYSSALEIAPNYWEPRFERAVSYTFYPEQMGMLPEAIRDFETLVKQQSRSSAELRFAETYAHLARAYVRTGKKDKAEAVLREAAALFPENEALQKQLEDLKE
ncbi:MAG: tetratricopeptide repeat protein [Planctomycetes bacterium]|nr:tetratricopeptide repeat protein [Planctomycetota bacterium]